MIAMIVGTVLALLTLAYVLHPLLVESKPRGAGSSVRVCPECGRSSEADASFCSSCGSPVDASR